MLRALRGAEQYGSIASLALTTSGRTLHIEAWEDADKPIQEAATPPSSWYTSRDVAQLERSLVFHRNWQMVAHASQLQTPGSYVTGSVAGMPHVVCRNSGGGLRAFHNVCRHHAAAVAKGSGVAQQFQCGYHGWTYGLDGRLQQAKRLKGIKGFQAADNGLLPLSVEAFGPFVFVAHQPAEPSLQCYLATGGERLLPRISGDHQHVGSRTYTLRCNWKVFADNYLDGGYHVPVAHRDLAGSLDMSSYCSETFEHVFVQSVRPAEASAERLAGSSEAGEAAMYAFVYPNLMVNVYGRWIDTNVVVPISEDRCSVQFDWYLQSSPADADDCCSDTDFISRSLAASHEVQQEDVELCEDVQRGLSSPAYNTGRYAPTVETPMYQFHQLLSKHLRQTGW